MPTGFECYHPSTSYDAVQNGGVVVQPPGFYAYGLKDSSTQITSAGLYQADILMRAGDIIDAGDHWVVWILITEFDRDFTYTFKVEPDLYSVDVYIPQSGYATATLYPKANQQLSINHALAYGTTTANNLGLRLNRNGTRKNADEVTIRADGRWYARWKGLNPPFNLGDNNLEVELSANGGAYAGVVTGLHI